MNREMIKYERKICLPLYKIACSVCFTVLLSLVRGISSTEEIGITLNTAMPVLAAVFCADCYQSEYSGKRWEIFRLYTVRSKVKSICVRLMVQCLYLCLLVLVGYACFFWQRPSNWFGTPQSLLLAWTMTATTATVFFFATLAMTLANIGKNSWFGTGAALVVWMTLNSVRGKALLGKYNIFSFAFRDILSPGDCSWLAGIAISVMLTIAMFAALPEIIRKRG